MVTSLPKINTTLNFCCAPVPSGTPVVNDTASDAYHGYKIHACKKLELSLKVRSCIGHYWTVHQVIRCLSREDELHLSNFQSQPITGNIILSNVDIPNTHTNVNNLTIGSLSSGYHCVSCCAQSSQL